MVILFNAEKKEPPFGPILKSVESLPFILILAFWNVDVMTVISS